MEGDILMQNRCKDCHFYEPAWDGVRYNTLGEPYRNPCAEIMADGWEYWQENSREPEHCESYVKAGTYQPTGVWAGLAKVIEKVKEETENETPD